ncbi:hypothetical protein EMIT036CA2_90080 [Chryseobacterium sp. IT-36CA2]
MSHVKNEQQYLVVAFKLFVGSGGIVMLLITTEIIKKQYIGFDGYR